MATNFKYQGTDLDNLLEPKQYSFNPPSPDFNGYKINNVSMTNRFAAYNGKGWEKLFSSTYLYAGSPILACRKGYKPTVMSRFATINGSAGAGTRNVYISRTDSALTFSGDISMTFGPSTFRNGVVPKVIAVIACGGGGGSTYQSKKENVFFTQEWKAGGGGGCIAWFVLNIEDNPSVRLSLGSGGGQNTNGGNTQLFIGNTTIFTLGGGGSGVESTGATQAGGNYYFANSNSHVFSTTGAVLDRNNRNAVRGCRGWGTGSASTTDGCLARVTFDASDPVTDFGTPEVSIPRNCGWGGGSLNGSMIGQGSSGTNGAGAGYGGSAGGGGAAFFFY